MAPCKMASYSCVKLPASGAVGVIWLHHAYALKLGPEAA